MTRRGFENKTFAVNFVLRFFENGDGILPSNVSLDAVSLPLGFIFLGFEARRSRGDAVCPGEGRVRVLSSPLSYHLVVLRALVGS